MDGNAHDPAVQVLGQVRLVTLLFSLMEISFKCRAVCTATHIFLMARVNHNVFMNSGLSLCVCFRATYGLSVLFGVVHHFQVWQ